MRKSLKNFNPEKDIHQGPVSGRSNKTPRTPKEEAISSAGENNYDSSINNATNTNEQCSMSFDNGTLQNSQTNSVESSSIAAAHQNTVALTH